MTSSKHTQLPWGIERTENDIWIGPLRKYGDGKVESVVVHFNLTGYKPSYVAMNEANAALIVNAVNLHGELFDACNNAIQVIEQLVPEESARGVANLVMFQLRAAIAKAQAANG